MREEGMMTAMEKLQFWKTTEGGVHSFSPTRLSRKRAILRTLCFLTLALLIYHSFMAYDIRRSIGEQVNQRLHPSGNAAQAEKTGIPISDSTEEGEWMEAEEVVDKTTIGKEKATLLMLVRQKKPGHGVNDLLRNREMREALGSMRMVEDRFNNRYKYPWTFMNDQPFSESFIKYTTGMASGPVEYVVIPKDNWSVPDKFNMTVINQGMSKMVQDGIIYGGSLSYRHMCRFNSGFFYHQKALEKYDWYWRVEPSIEIYCDIPYDPFTYMRKNGKVYGWVITMYEFLDTIPTLWQRTKEFVKKNPQYLAEDNSLNFMSDGANVSQALQAKNIDNTNYNLCHFWSNFEIADLNFFRSEAYQKYFEYLDNTGGFFYERWGDAPVHSIALSLFLPRSKIHHFSDFGYNHAPAARCPQDEESHHSGRCYCDRSVNFDLDNYSCTPRWFERKPHFRLFT
ncbi:nucleotide-diphospho-sugar transferase [Geopyxis carbonaria]|nr:nucleotide-diphospho-sugar transferase [Geopyxis carbonaria]